MISLIKLGAQTSKDRIEECRKDYAKWATKHNQERANGISSPVDSESSTDDCGSSVTRVPCVPFVFEVPSEVPPLKLL